MSTVLVEKSDFLSIVRILYEISINQSIKSGSKPAEGEDLA
jgi:hypothetical protein